MPPSPSKKNLTNVQKEGGGERVKGILDNVKKTAGVVKRYIYIGDLSIFNILLIPEND